MDLGLGEPLASFNQFAFIGNDDALQLLSLSEHLLSAGLYFLLKVEVLLKK